MHLGVAETRAGVISAPPGVYCSGFFYSLKQSEDLPIKVTRGKAAHGFGSRAAGCSWYRCCCFI